MLARLTVTTLAVLTAAAPAAAAQARETGVADLEARAAYTLRYAQDAESVVGLGDVDGDGHRDAALLEDTGDVRVVLAGDDPGVRSFRIVGAASDVESFAQVADAGDVNGDGLADVVVPAENLRAGDRAVSAVVVFGRRRAADVNLRRPEERDLTLLGTPGSQVRAAGDVNGDGFGDLVTSGVDPALSSDVQEGDGVGTARVAAVVLGGPDARVVRDLHRLGGAGFVIRRRVGGEDALADLVVIVAGAGDLDGDGLSDVVVGSPLSGLPAEASTEEEDEDVLLRAPGAAFVVYGRRARTPIDLRGPGVTRVPGVGGLLGYPVAAAGDVDGDGLDDVALGATYAGLPLSGTSTPGGRVYELLGRRERSATVALGGSGVQRVDGPARSGTGATLAAGGDLDGDGRGELLVGAPGLLPFPVEGDDPGAVHVVFGGSPGRVDLDAPGDRALTLRGSGGEQAGRGVGVADLDADGRPEVLAARPGRCRVARLGEGDVVGVELGSPAAALAGRGGAGADALRGSDVGDGVFGFDGADALDGRDGHDCLLAGDGDDVVRGGALGDAMFGEDGLDRLLGGMGCDRLFGGGGDDVIVAGPGRVPPGLAVLAPRGARDRDRADGGDGEDAIAGGLDDDELRGGAGDDRLRGDAGDDGLAGDRGSDRLEGGSGDDSLSGDGLDGSDFFDDDERAAFLPREPDDDVLLGGPGRDALGGDGGDDRLFGGDGADRLEGEDGRDRLSGGDGPDRLDGGTGADTLRGGAGDDRVFARGDGRDVVECGPGRDVARVDRADRVRGCERVVRSGARRGE